MEESYKMAFKQLVAGIQARLNAYKLNPGLLEFEVNRTRHEVLHELLQDAEEIERRFYEPR